MKKSYTTLGVAALTAAMLITLPVTTMAADKLKPAGEPAKKALEEEISNLRQLVDQLNSRLTDAEKKLKEKEATPAVADKEKEKINKKLSSLESTVGDLEDRVDKTEKHTVTDKLSLSVDMRTELTGLNYKDARVLQDWNQSMLSLWAFNKLAVPFSDYGIPNLVTMPADGVVGAGADATPDYTFNGAFAQKYGSELMKMMPMMLQNNFLAGFYLPMGMDNAPGGAGANADNFFVTSATAKAAMAAGATMPATAMPIIQTNANGKPLFGPEFTGADLAMYQGMFKNITPQKQNIRNDALWTSRARIDMKADPTANLGFMGRLSANKVWGDSTGVKWFSGDFSSVAMDGNVSQKGSDSAIRLERAFATYKNEFNKIPWHLSLGRRPATEGEPWDVAAHSVIGGSPLSHAINFQFDGASLGFDLSDVSGVPGFNFKLCYGFGFESGAGSGNSYAMDYSNNVDDVNFLGWIFVLYNDEKYKIANMTAHAFDVSDGFTGLVAMPFSIAGLDVDRDGRYDVYSFKANEGGYTSRMEAFSNIGDLDLTSFLFRGKFGKTDAFIDLAASHTDPSGRSGNPMMQFMGNDTLLGSDGEIDSQWGYSLWAGVKTPLTLTGGFVGAEFNWGSRYWLGFNSAEDTINASKLAARGKVYELYYHHPLLESKLLLSMGVQFWDYDYTLSGSPLGNPKKLEDVTALDSLMPVPENLWAYYINVNYRW